MGALANPDRCLRDVAGQQLERLAAAASLDPGGRRRLHRVFARLTEGGLDRPAHPPFSGLSAINVSGLPLQWSVSAGRHPSADVRFLCEGGPLGAPGPVRLDCTLRRLHEACTWAGVSGAPYVEELARKYLLPKQGEWPAHWRSAMWTAVGAAGDRIGFKAYFNLTSGEPIDRWKRAGRLLQALGRHASLERLCRFSGLVSRDSWPTGIAIGIGSGREAGGVKIYFRSGAVDTGWLARWYRACGFGAGQEAARFLLETFAPPSRLPYAGGAFVVSLEFPASDGPPALKTELEISRWSQSERDTSRRVCRLLRGLGLDGEGYEAALDALSPSLQGETIHRLAGVRCDASGELRVNIYIEPPLPTNLMARARAARPPARAAQRDTIRRAGEWLRDARADRHWSDFALPVGAADRWVTAYVSFALSLAMPAAPYLKPLLTEGCGWLESHRGEKGWGYNAATPDDADSTALAVLALRSLGRDPGGSELALLRSCRNRSGGFSTYPPSTPPGGAWCEGVADVTPVAAEALGGLSKRTLAWILDRQRTDGLWDAYWWTTPLYPSWWVARVFGPQLPSVARARLIRGLREWCPAGAFELALTTLALAALGEDPSAPARTLLETQNQDGSWNASACLRLSSPAQSQPWAGLDSGPCFFDERRILTTATALAALAAADSPGYRLAE